MSTIQSDEDWLKRCSPWISGKYNFLTGESTFLVTSSGGRLTEMFDWPEELGQFGSLKLIQREMVYRQAWSVRLKLDAEERAVEELLK